MSIQKKLSLLILLSIFICLFFASGEKSFAMNLDAAIRSKISLPTGTIAPAGGSNADYTVTIPKNDPGSAHYIQHHMNNSSNYINDYYHNTTGVQPSSYLATLVHVSPITSSEINVQELTARTVSGTISLPAGRIAPSGGLAGWVYIYTTDGGNYYSGYFDILSGTSGAGYSVSVPANEIGTGYVVHYSLNDGSSYVQRGYYSTSGTVTNFSLASIVDVSSENKSGINLTLLTGNTISGTVYLPLGKSAPTGGLAGGVYIFADTGENYYCAFNMPAGGSSAAYSAVVPVNTIGSGYKAYYSLNDGSGYVQFGYYSIGSTVTNSNLASTVDVSSGNKSGINLTLITGNAISGTVYLPSGMVAPIGGIYGVIIISNNTVENENYFSYFYIPADGNSVVYSEVVPVNTVGSGYTVSYDIDVGSSYIRHGYYSISGTVTNSSLASTVDVSSGNKPGINLTLLTGNTISGTVYLPSGISAPTGGLSGSVLIFADTGEYYYYDFKMPAGGSSAAYSVVVPINANGSGYKVCYNLYGGSSYVQAGYYSTAGTVMNYNLSSIVDVSSGNKSGINLTLIKGNAISGTISLPVGLIAPSGGLAGWVNVFPVDGGDPYSSYFNIPTGVSSIDYSVVVPVNAIGSGYKVYYALDANSSYVSQGYYSISGTVTNYNLASTVDVSSGNRSGINMTLLTGNTISGTIYLPLGMIAPAGGITGSVEIYTNTGEQYGSYFEIPAGNGSVGYSEVVPINAIGSGYKVFYYLYTGNSYVQRGYYSTSGSVANSSQASTVDVSIGNKSGINMTLITGNTISGTVYLPLGMIAPALGLSGSVQIYSDTGEQYGYYFNLAAGSTSISYSVMVPVNAIGSGYKVYYYLYRDGSYFRTGYYSTSGTVTNFSKASTVDVSGGNKSGINLTLLAITWNKISGKLSLPVGAIAPAGGISATITATVRDDLYNSSYYTSDILIIAGENSADYTVTVPKNDIGSGYYVQYHINNSSIYMNDFYYSVNGVKSNTYYATLIDVSAGDSVGINMQALVARTISGTISLPGGRTAPAGGILVGMYVIIPTGGEVFYSEVIIPAGGNSTNYSITAPSNPAGLGYNVVYWLYSDNNYGYVQNGYYSTSGTVSNSSGLASIIDVSSENKTGINLTLLSGNTISGTVYLPSGMTAPSGGLSGSIYLSTNIGENYDYYYGYFSIPAGGSSASYSEVVPVNAIGSGYKIGSNLNNNGNVGYYSISGTTDYSHASIVDVSGGNVSGIDMTIRLLNSSTFSFNDELIRGITPGTLLEGFTAGIQIPDGYAMKVVKKDGTELLAGSKVGTGMKVQVLQGASIVYEYAIVIFGDTTGDGNINALDLLAVKRHILGLQTLAGDYAAAANTDHGSNGAINALDLLKIKRQILGLEVLVQ